MRHFGKYAGLDSWQHQIRTERGRGGGKSVGKGDPLSDVDDRRSDNEIKSPLGHERLGGDW